MKKLIIYFILISFSSLNGKEYNLDELIQSAVKNSGYSKQIINYQKISNSEINEINSNNYPQITFDAQASYQSNVFEFPIQIPGISIPTIRKDQYNINLNLSQTVYDGGVVSESRDLSKISADLNIENSKIKVRNQIENITALFYSAQKLNVTLQNVKLALNTLESNKSQINSLIKNGVLLKSNLDVIEIQISLKKQNLKSIEFDYSTILKNLEILCGINELSKLNFKEVILDDNLKINRSEIYSFEKIKELNNKKSNLKFTSITPKITAFAKLGYGNPNSLNMFEQSWSEFYMLGVKFSWKPFAWFNESQNEEMTSVLNDNLEIEKSEFLKQINTQLEMEYSELSKIELLIEQDLIIIDLQKRIKVEKYNQFLNGTATIHDYITEFNALQIYETNLELHKIMYENVKNNILIKSGNFVGN